MRVDDEAQKQAAVPDPITGETSIAVWGGVECTCNRVGNQYFDQLAISGHQDRVSDLEIIASIGIGTLRAGIPWERHAWDPSWRNTDAWFGTMRNLGIRPIAGLEHHGSGPPHTSLLDPEFPESLANYAAEVARRYPWIDAYTPVNEPHTTARFSGLYGIWYPHHMDYKSYLRALLNELKATVLSMQRIREIQPEAQLIQTEDFGFTFGTKELQPICDVMNERRWLPIDLLCGVVDERHSMFDYVIGKGIPANEILWFRDHPCPPDIVGINYYATSDRFLDHRIGMYPKDRRSAEGRFVDVEAVRVRSAEVGGFEAVLSDAWNRHKIPVALTEVHLGGPTEEQIRWVWEAWQGIMNARQRGASCTAMTFWALLGSFYWDRLVTCNNGHYEHGVFELRNGEPVPTELARVVAQIARGEAPSHSALFADGWWRSESRFCFSASEQQFSADAA